MAGGTVGWMAGEDDGSGEPGLLAALETTHVWFERNSGWAPPDQATLDDWAADGVCRCPDDCLVAVRGVCAHGLASWQLVLEALASEDAAARHVAEGR